MRCIRELHESLIVIRFYGACFVATGLLDFVDKKKQQNRWVLANFEIVLKFTSPLYNLVLILWIPLQIVHVAYNSIAPLPAPRHSCHLSIRVLAHLPPKKKNNSPKRGTYERNIELIHKFVVHVNCLI